MTTSQLLDFIMTLSDLNIIYEDKINLSNLKEVYKENPTENSYENFILTHCITTANAIKYLLSDEDWEYVDEPALPIYEVLFFHENDDEEDYPEHTLIVADNNIYQSSYNLCNLIKITPKENIKLLLENPVLNYEKLTTDTNPISEDIALKYKQPRDLNNLNRIYNKYLQLK